MGDDQQTEIAPLRCYSCGHRFAAIPGGLDVTCPRCGSDSYSRNPRAAQQADESCRGPHWPPMTGGSPAVTGEALAVWLRRTVLGAGRAQVLLARDSGLSTKHVNQMLKGHISGSLDAWDRLLDAALRPPPPALSNMPAQDGGAA